MTDLPPALPHGPLTQVVDGVWAVQSGFRMGPGVTITRTMTVVAAGDGLVVLNAARLSSAGQDEIDALGKVKHLVKLSDSHGIDEPYYVDRYKPQVWTLSGSKLGAIGAGNRLGPEGPIADGVVIDYGARASGWRECAYLVPHGGGTLVTCDAIQNCVGTDGYSFLGKVITPLMGFKGGVIVPPMWRRFQKVSGGAVRDVLRGLTTQSYTHLVTGHGPPVAGGAAERVRQAIEAAAAA